MLLCWRHVCALDKARVLTWMRLRLSRSDDQMKMNMMIEEKERNS